MGPLGSLGTTFVADDSKATQWPSGLMEAPRLSPLPSAPPGPTLMRTVETTEGGMPGSPGWPPAPGTGATGGLPGESVARNTSTWPLVSPSTRLSAADAYTSFVPSSLIVRLVQRRGVSGEQASELPLSARALRSAPLPAMLTRSIVPTGTDEWAASIPGPAARPATIATAPRTATHRRPKPPPNPSSRFIPQPPALDVTVTSHARTGPKAEHAFSFSTRKRAFLPKGTKRRKSSPGTPAAPGP